MRLGALDPIVHWHSSEEMPEIGTNSARLAIVAPPFTHHPDGKTLDKESYLLFIRQVFSQVFRVLQPYGVMVTINTDLRDHARYNHGDRRFNGLVWQKHGDIRHIAETVGFRCTDTKIWAKSLRSDVYRYTFAYMQFFQKAGIADSDRPCFSVAEGFRPDVWLLEKGTYRRDSRGYVFRDAIHPEIARRCIEQYTLPGDLVVSPFTGSGTIMAVACLMGRRCIGYEINQDLEPMIRESVETPARLPVYSELLKHLAVTAEHDIENR